MGPKSKFEWSVLSSVTAVAVALLVMQLIHNGWSVDGWVLALIGISGLPWFWRVLESVEFPGGGGVKMRKLENQVERQADEIKALQFLVANFLTGGELKYLRILASSEPLTVGREHDSMKAFEAVERLKTLGLVQKKTGLNPAALVGSDLSDMKELFEISGLGREYLTLRDITADSRPVPF